MQKIEALVQAGQHAERKAVDLEQLHLLEIVLVPLDDRAVGHRRVLDRHEMMQRLLGNHEAADVLRKMPRKTVDFARQREQSMQDAARRIEAALGEPVRQRAAALHAREQAGQPLELIFGSPSARPTSRTALRPR